MNEFTLKGTIIFDPKDKTNKHKNQASWKKIAMVVFDDKKMVLECVIIMLGLLKKDMV